MTEQLEVRQNAAIVIPFRQSPCRAAVRFPVRLELTIQSSSGVFLAYTENVSASGLLFVCSHLPSFADRIEFTMCMPAEILGVDKDVQVHCVGRIVRRERGRNPESSHVDGLQRTSLQPVGLRQIRAAVMIDEYNLKA